MSKIGWIVSSGAYSDYGVKAIFSTEKKAQAYVDVFNSANTYEKADVEEFALDPEPPEVCMTVSLVISKGGDIIKISEPELILVSKAYGYGCVGFYTSRQLGLGLEHPPMYTIVTTDSKERAVKVANERRTIVVANDAWDNTRRAHDLLFKNKDAL